MAILCVKITEIISHLTPNQQKFRESNGFSTTKEVAKDLISRKKVVNTKLK